MSFEGISFKRFLRGANHEPIAPDEEKVLIRKCKNGDAEARNRLIEGNQRFVIRMAMGMRDQGLPIADLIQEGNLGLIESIERFDPERGCRLISYGAWWIRLYMQRAVEQKSRTVTIPINKISMLKKIRNFEFTYQKCYGFAPKIDDIAEALGQPAKKIEDAIRSASSCHSIHAPDDSGQTLADKLPGIDTGPLLHGIWISELSRRIKLAMTALTDRERAVLSHRFGLEENTEPLSLRQVGRNLGLSAEGVRQIQEQALQKLRTPEVAPMLEQFTAV